MFQSLAKDPIWSLERRPSSGFLVWRSDESKVRFRFEVEVLEYEKNPDEHKIYWDAGPSAISSTIVVCVTCIAAVAATFFLPWYLVGTN